MGLSGGCRAGGGTQSSELSLGQNSESFVGFGVFLLVFFMVEWLNLCSLCAGNGCFVWIFDGV